MPEKKKNLNKTKEEVNLELEELRRKNSELEKSEVKYRSLFEYLSQGVVYQDADGRIISANPAAESILGLTFAQLQGRESIDPRWKAIHEDGSDFPGDTHPAMLSLKTGKPVHNTVMGVFHPGKDQYIWINVEAIPQFRDNEKKPYQVFTTFTDITERNQVVQMLREKDFIIRSASSCIATADLNGILTYVNQAFLEKWGFDNLEEMIGQHFHKYWMVDNELDTIMKALLGEERQWSGELKAKKKDGSLFDVQSFAAAILNEKGIPIGIMSTSTEITARKLAEETLRKNEEQFRSLITNLNAVIFIINKDGFFELSEGKGLIGLGLKPGEVVGLSVWDFYKDYPSIIESLKKAFKGEIINSIEQIGETTLDVWYSILKDGKLLGASTDISERKQSEDKLRVSEEKLNALFTSLTEMIVMHELVLNSTGQAIDYRIIDCNNVFTEVTGIRKEDAIGKLASELYQADPPPYLEIYAKVGLEGDPHEFTTFFPPMNKHFLISVVSTKAGKFATITTDISEMMKIQEMIIAKNKEMENYLYIASHDLRTPLVNIQGFSQRLKTQADSIKTLFADKTLEPEILHQLAMITDEDIPKTLNFILNNIEKMDTLIKCLLQLSRTGSIEMNIQKIDMNAMFSKILQSLDFQINESQCEIHIDTLPECYGDAVLLDQLFANIISNALKYSDSERALKIIVNAKNIYNRVIYTIRDTGKGITQKHLDKIWDIFYRIDPRSGKTGEGIGLSLVKRIVEKHKGKVWAESEENKGSAFHIELNNSLFTEL